METIAKFMMEYPFIYLSILYIVNGVLVSTITLALIIDIDKQELKTTNSKVPFNLVFEFFIPMTLLYPVIFLFSLHFIFTNTD